MKGRGICIHAQVMPFSLSHIFFDYGSHVLVPSENVEGVLVGLILRSAWKRFENFFSYKGKGIGISHENSHCLPRRRFLICLRAIEVCCLKHYPQFQLSSAPCLQDAHLFLLWVFSSIRQPLLRFPSSDGRFLLVFLSTHRVIMVRCSESVFNGSRLFSAIVGDTLWQVFT